MILCNCNITISHSSARCWPREFLFCHFIGFGLHFCESTVLSDYFSKCGNENICKYKAVLGKACFFFIAMNLHGARCTHLLALRHLFACFAALMHSLRRAHSLASFIVEWMLKMNYTFFYKNSLFSQSLDKRVSPSVRPSVTPTHFRRFRHASEHRVASIGSCFHYWSLIVFLGGS